eukprot:gene43349-53821_t
MPVSYIEWIGVLISFGGMVLSDSKDLFGDSDSSMSASQHRYEYLGFFLCFLAAAAEVLVLFNRIATKKYVPLMQYTASTTIVVCSCATIMSVLLEGTRVFCLGDDCVFGWASKKWALKILLFGLWVGVICIA